MALGNYDHQTQASLLHGETNRLWSNPPFAGRTHRANNSTYGAQSLNSSFRASYYELPMSSAQGGARTPAHDPTISETVYAHYTK
jgi:hypothetical protein